MSKLSFRSLKVSDLVRILQQAGSQRATREGIETHLQEGAPRNDDGTINLIHYVAWLIGQAK